MTWAFRIAVVGLTDFSPITGIAVGDGVGDEYARIAGAGFADVDTGNDDRLIDAVVVCFRIDIFVQHGHTVDEPASVCLDAIDGDLQVASLLFADLQAAIAKSVVVGRDQCERRDEKPPCQTTKPSSPGR